MPGNPLLRHQVLCTSDPEGLEQQLISILGVSRFDLVSAGSLDASLSFLEFGDTAFGFGRVGAVAEATFPEGDFARLQVPLGGSGRTDSSGRSAISDRNHLVLSPVGYTSTLHYGEDFQQIFVRLNGRAIERQLTALLGAPVQRLPRFGLNDFPDPRLTAALRHLVEFIVHQINDGESFLAQPAFKELEQSVITQVLFANRHTLSDLLKRDPLLGSADQVRLAEEYIAANWDRAVTIEALAVTTGVSARTLFRSFEKLRGYSPKAFLKKTRLERAKALLSDPSAERSVTGVALACGYSNLGQFSREFREMFGELPSGTLKRSRRL